MRFSALVVNLIQSSLSFAFYDVLLLTLWYLTIQTHLTILL